MSRIHYEAELSALYHFYVERTFESPEDELEALRSRMAAIRASAAMSNDQRQFLFHLAGTVPGEAFRSFAGRLKA